MTLGSEVSQLSIYKQREVGDSAILGTEVSQPEYIALSWSATRGTEASQLENIAISGSTTIGSD